jgi:polyhydroxybutyrate depolymerase
MAVALLLSIPACAAGGPTTGEEQKDMRRWRNERVQERRERLRERLENRRGRGAGGAALAGNPGEAIDSSYPGFNDAPFGPGNYRRHLGFDGRQRFYDLHVPPSYSDRTQMPVVLVFHGGAGNPLQQRHDSVMDPGADAYGFIVAYPAGTGRLQTRMLTYNAGVCCGYAKQNSVDDVGFTDAVIKDLSTLFNIDKARVYATGFSNGAFMTYRLACELSRQIAAVAPVSGTLGIDRCNPARPVPIIHFHGRQDPNAVYEGGIGPNARERIPRRGVRETIQIFLDRYGLPQVPSRTGRAGQASYEQFGPDDIGTEIVLWTLEDGGHTWPGGRTTIPEEKMGRLSTDIRASELMWKFFERYSIP